MRNDLGVNYRKILDKHNHYEELRILQNSRIDFLEKKIDSKNKEIKNEKIIRYISYSVFILYIILTKTII